MPIARSSAAISQPRALGPGLSEQVASRSELQHVIIRESKIRRETLRHGPMKPRGLTNAHQPEVKAYAQKMLPKLQAHLKMAQELVNGLPKKE